MNNINLDDTMLFVVLVLWLITVLLLLRERKRQSILKKNSEWSALKAREKAEEIIQEARKSVLKELTDVQVDTKMYKDKLEDGVKRLTEQEIDQYKQAIDGITQEVEQGVIEQSKQYKSEFDKSWKLMQAELLNKINLDYAIEKKKLEDYSSVKMKQIEEQIAGIVDEAVLAVLEKQTDEQITKKLILEALNEAKAKYGF